jgi:hypothetical protein
LTRYEGLNTGCLLASFPVFADRAVRKRML